MSASLDKRSAANGRNFARGAGCIATLSCFTAAAQAPAGVELEEVLVTATRTRSDYAAPTPTTVIGEETLDKLQISNLSQLFTQTPSLKATISPTANGVRTQLPGAALADLRALGTNRTLVLVNGMRVTPQAPANTTGVTVSPDMNQIPALMVKRVEVVTGGASAQWGSDAVAGVLNILLRTDFNGFEAKVQGGQSTKNDARQYRVGLIGGTDFADGRGHVTAAIDATRLDELGDIYTRDWGRQEFQILTNPSPATNGLPANIVTSNIHTSLAPGGLITGPAGFSLRNSQFMPGGTLRPFVSGSLVSGQIMIGGEGASLAKGIAMAPEVDRLDPFVHAEYKIADNAKLFIEAGYSWVKGQTTVLPPRDSALTIRVDNPYLPAPVVTALTAQSLPSFTMSRVDYDLGGNAIATIHNKTPHAAFGASGDFDENAWHWDAHVGWGRNQYTNEVERNRITRNYTFAVDAVQSGANIVCRATLPGASFNAAATGCVPINLFGAGAPSQAAIGYVTGTSRADAVYQQYNAAANLRGEPVNLWAGPLSVAAGLEYRREKEDVTADPIAQAGLYEASNATAFSGKFDVKEGYVETILPLVRDSTIAKSLALNAAVRVADYSTAGNQTTWKGGLTYEPIKGLLFRGTRSRDIRAPALFELYSQGAISNVPVSVRNLTATIPTNVSLGSPNLKPEAADTTTAGIVITPVAWPDFSASLDYYDIDLKDAITSVTAANAGSLCTAGQTFYCNAFTYNPVTGAPTSLTLPVVNASSIHTKGYDLALSYHMPLSDWWSNAPGALNFNLSGTYVTHYIQDVGSGAGAVERAGDITVTPKLRATLTTTYSIGATSLTAQLLHVSGANLNNTFNISPATTVNDNTVPSYTYLNLFASHGIDKDGHLQVFASMSNVFDKDPPAVPSSTLFVATSGAFYDVVGRAYLLGATYRF